MNNTETIETERLILRRIEKSDYKDMFNNWASDSEVSKYLTWETHKNNEETKQVIENWVEEYKIEHTYRWIVTLKDTKTPIGTIDVVSKSINEKRAEIGYCYGKNWWGQGFATEALKEVLKYVNKKGFELITAKHLISNPASGKVMEKAGMEYNATLKIWSLKKDGTREDVKVYYYYQK